jgi:hypothetical protein
MTDLTPTIAAKSDQLNADDLIGGPRTITITKVTADPSSSEQPVAIYHNLDPKKPFKPCKTVRRLLVAVWGADGSAYIGRSMTIYRDPSVEFGGIAVGGIRISHMSHIDQPMTIALTEKRSRRKPHTVKPLKMDQPKEQPKQPDANLPERGQDAARNGMDAYKSFWKSINAAERAALEDFHEEFKGIAAAVDAEKKDE